MVTRQEQHGRMKALQGKGYSANPYVEVLKEIQHKHEAFEVYGEQVVIVSCAMTMGLMGITTEFRLSNSGTLVFQERWKRG